MRYTTGAGGDTPHTGALGWTSQAEVTMERPADTEEEDYS